MKIHNHTFYKVVTRFSENDDSYLKSFDDFETATRYCQQMIKKKPYSILECNVVTNAKSGEVKIRKNVIVRKTLSRF